MARKGGNVIGGWAFLIGVVLAVVLGFLGNINSTMAIILVIIGIVIGLLNIADKESAPFLMSGAVLVIVSAFGQNALGVVEKVSDIVDALLILFVPATIVVAVRHVLTLARN